MKEKVDSSVDVVAVVFLPSFFLFPPLRCRSRIIQNKQNKNSRFFPLGLLRRRRRFMPGLGLLLLPLLLLRDCSSRRRSRARRRARSRHRSRRRRRARRGRPRPRRGVYDRLDLRHRLQAPRRGLERAQQRRVERGERGGKPLAEPRVRGDLGERDARGRVGRQQPSEEVGRRGRDVGRALVLCGDDAREHLLEADEVVGALVASLGKGQRALRR